MGKFIVIDNQVIMGNHEYHNQMVPKSMSDKKIKPSGGGRWNWDEEKNIVYFYGASLDFGYISAVEFNIAFKESMISPFMDESKIVFSNKLKFEEVLTDTESSIIQYGRCDYAINELHRDYTKIINLIDAERIGSVLSYEGRLVKIDKSRSDMIYFLGETDSFQPNWDNVKIDYTIK